MLLAGCGSSPALLGNGPTQDANDATPGGEDAGARDSAGLEAAVASQVSRFVTKVVSYTPGSCAGFGQASMPGIVEGPPVGGGTEEGSVDVVSLGGGGEIIVSFAPNAIVDGPGVDFLVFENPFWINGNPDDLYDEPGEVSVSEDGVNWVAFPCTAPQSAPPPYGACGGWHIVYSTPDNGIDPLDPKVAGGDPFDLAQIGVSRAQFVRIVDKTEESCTPSGDTKKNGFDLDAIGIVNAEMP
jgi:hypothetical protein